jgi:hypothetical protein
MKPAVLSPIVPEVVMVPPVKPLLVAIEVTVPEPPAPRQVPEGIKMQPLERAIPFPKVEVAEVEVMLRALASTPQAKVLVAVVEVAVR